jgi:hypothetical protein
VADPGSPTVSPSQRKTLAELGDERTAGVGDVTKRCATAVGEEAMAVQFVHAHLAEHEERVSASEPR